MCQSPSELLGLLGTRRSADPLMHPVFASCSVRRSQPQHAGLLRMWRQKLPRRMYVTSACGYPQPSYPQPGYPQPGYPPAQPISAPSLTRQRSLPTRPPPPPQQQQLYAAPPPQYLRGMRRHTQRDLRQDLKSGTGGIKLRVPLRRRVPRRAYYPSQLL